MLLRPRDAMRTVLSLVPLLSALRPLEAGITFPPSGHTLVMKAMRDPLSTRGVARRG